MTENERADLIRDLRVHADRFYESTMALRHLKLAAERYDVDSAVHYFIAANVKLSAAQLDVESAIARVEKAVTIL